ncbi:hydroxyacylglutathione hydrolase-like protein isoform X6 [Neofelis nebulosa]|uniref:hydroxyacylglutathione hydrolase-like protein isoform X6 n=1 Tax=Neofelis nebulosa TaxID=61452 RepID=UPI002729D0F5|nr:hydroxyacylglutathione hydrolase-like protein isoform X6 [Neofelis nebulosa]XP_058567786.1 hydroxyacylglutathione hydrolase-like protein isoform X6 [Neofelis nebulosa]XP_058567787.1 hydroxyacylglutathione hydrolase-like protein isoform X6 [Neofelis nebulosa]
MAQLPSREGFAEDAPQRPAWRGRTCVRPPPGTRAPPPAHACSLRRGAGRWRRPGGAPRSARALRIVPWAHLCPAVSQAVRAVGGRAQPLRDNYMYLVIEEHTREAVAVDVAVPKRLLEIVGREGVSLTTVLTTHHHWDHARGNAELARLRPGLAVLGADERICALTRRLVHGEELQGMRCRWVAVACAWRAQLSKCIRAWSRPWGRCPPRRRCSVATSTRWATLSLHRKWSPAMTT